MIINNGINITENCCPICFEDINNILMDIIFTMIVYKLVRMGNQDNFGSIPNNNEEGRYSFKII